MQLTSLGKLAFVGTILLVASACSKTPTQPSVSNFNPPEQAGAAITLSNLNGRFVGVADQICGDGSDQVPIDDLTMEYHVDGGSLYGAMLSACDTAACESGAPIGPIVQCPIPPDPCATGVRAAIAQHTAPVCLTGDPTGSGTLRFFAPHAVDRTNWNLVAYFQDGDGHSNAVTASVDVPEGSVVTDGSITGVRSVRRLRR